jgi:hypothetical protein
MIFAKSVLLAYLGAVAASSTLRARVVKELNQAATAEAHQRDDTATRAFSNIQIKVWLDMLEPGK